LSMLMETRLGISMESLSPKKDGLNS
jgi:hypothetical protein